MTNTRNEVRFEITEQIAVLAEYTTGWRKELNMVAWNDNPPKYDIRDWSPEHEFMSKGITLKPEEMKNIVEAVKDREFTSRESDFER